MEWMNGCMDLGGGGWMNEWMDALMNGYIGRNMDWYLDPWTMRDKM
jgi:hypothetical protein